MSKPIIHPVYGIDLAANSLAHATHFEDESLAVQSEYEDTEINNIVRKFGMTGLLPNGDLREPIYGDFTTPVQSYQDALNLVIQSDEDFSQLPAHIRAKFNNNPAELLTFMNDPDNIDQARELGLVNPLQQLEGDAQAEAETGEQPPA